MLTKTIEQEEKVSAAFTAQSAVFDKLDRENFIIQWMRNRIREHSISFWKRGDRILELNAGTGLDAVFFAQSGFRVHATDNSMGMLAALGNKVESMGLDDKITYQQCSFLELNKIEGTQFNHIFSNFGGLNCTDKLGKIIDSFYPLLSSGGTAILVIMPTVCPWELALALKGNFKTAFRRLRRKGAISHVEGNYFNTYYYSPGQVRRMFGKRYSKLSLKGFCITVPPPYLENFPLKHPKMYKSLMTMEDKISSVAPFRSWADHFIITMRKEV